MGEQEAYKHALRAKWELNEAAEELGYENIHELIGEINNGLNFSDTDIEAVKSITNAYSYLDNGAVEELASDFSNPADL